MEKAKNCVSTSEWRRRRWKKMVSSYEEHASATKFVVCWCSCTKNLITFYSKSKQQTGDN